MTDRFKGPGYQRVTVTVYGHAGDLEASIYALRA